MKSVLILSILNIFFVQPVFAIGLENTPFQDDHAFILTRGYNTPPTHIGKEQYALDFTQNGCNAFGKSVTSIASGEIEKVNAPSPDNKDDYGGGFGYFVKIKHNDGTSSRYAHLSNVKVTSGHVETGQIIGLIGNTGNVTGTSCPEHPGVHLHFAMYQKTLDENNKPMLVGYQPEPMHSCSDVTDKKNVISPCVDFTSAHWYKGETVQAAVKNPIAQTPNTRYPVSDTSSIDFWAELQNFNIGDTLDALGAIAGTNITSLFNHFALFGNPFGAEVASINPQSSPTASNIDSSGTHATAIAAAQPTAPKISSPPHTTAQTPAEATNENSDQPQAPAPSGLGGNEDPHDFPIPPEDTSVSDALVPAVSSSEPPSDIQPSPPQIVEVNYGTPVPRSPNPELAIAPLPPPPPSPAPTLIVNTEVINNGVGTKQVSDFQILVNATAVTSGQATTFDQGTYQVTETPQSGYTVTFSGDCDSLGTITLALGDQKICTVINRYQYSLISEQLDKSRVAFSVCNNSGCNDLIMVTAVPIAHIPQLRRLTMHIQAHASGNMNLYISCIWDGSFRIGGIVGVVRGTLVDQEQDIVFDTMHANNNGCTLEYGVLLAVPEGMWANREEMRTDIYGDANRSPYYILEGENAN